MGSASASVEVRLAELTAAALDEAAVEALVLLVPPEERPLRGLAGLCDWRLCGALSRTLSGGWYGAGPGEVLLTPTGGRIGPGRLFVFGLGAREGREAELSRLLPRVLDALRRARVESVGFALPWPGLELAASVAQWAEFAPQGPRRQLLFGQAAAIARELSARSGAFRVCGA